MSTETLKVLRAAADLGEFTRSELASVSGASYETVKKVLSEERGKTVEKTDRLVKSSVGRPREVWVVLAQEAIAERIEQVISEVEKVIAVAEGMRSARLLPLESTDDTTDVELAAAEDYVVFALNAEDRQDASAFAREAIAQIEEQFGDILGDNSADTPLTLEEKQNLPRQIGRVRVIEAVSRYILSTEAEDIQGPLWQRAFRTVASFDDPDQDAVHKFIMAKLVAMATIRDEVTRERVGQLVGNSRTSSHQHSHYAVGVALGVSEFQVAVVNAHGHPRTQWRAPLPEDMDFETVVTTIAGAVNGLLDMSEFDDFKASFVLGVQVGGPVDTETGVVHFFAKRPPDLSRTPTGNGMRSFSPEEIPTGFPPWSQAPLGQRLQRETGLLTLVENDANTFVSKEKWFGVGRETPNFAVMLIREGIGGSVVRDRVLFTGPVEVGHLIMHDYTPTFERVSDTGQVGGLEAEAGTTAILEDIYYNGDGCLVKDVDEAVELAKMIDNPPSSADEQRAKVAIRAFGESGKTIGRGASYLVNLFGPTQIVLYGPSGMFDRGNPAGKAFLEEFEKFQEAIPDPFWETFLQCEPIYRPLGPYDDAYAASLFALERCFGVSPRKTAFLPEKP